MHCKRMAYKAVVKVWLVKFVYIWLLSLRTGVAGRQQAFKAAVFDHVVISHPAADRTQALVNMRQNLDVFRHQIMEAKSKVRQS